MMTGEIREFVMLILCKQSLSLSFKETTICYLGGGGEGVDEKKKEVEKKRVFLNR